MFHPNSGKNASHATIKIPDKILKHVLFLGLKLAKRWGEWAIGRLGDWAIGRFQVVAHWNAVILFEEWTSVVFVDS